MGVWRAKMGRKMVEFTPKTSEIAIFRTQTPKNRALKSRLKSGFNLKPQLVCVFIFSLLSGFQETG